MMNGLMESRENQLIAMLPRQNRLRLLDICEPVQLKLGAVLCEPDEPTRHIYFPTSSFISLVTRINGEPGLEVGMVGGEGMLGAQVALGVLTTPMHALVQGDGHSHRIATAAFRRELAGSPPLQRVLNRYLYVLMAQLASAAACTRFHAVGPRLARWLLMSQDRAHSDDFHLTHEFLAYMLGVRRVGITGAAGKLQRGGLISYHRGAITVLDRPGLEAMACSCYGANNHVYEQQLS